MHLHHVLPSYAMASGAQPACSEPEKRRDVPAARSPDNTLNPPLKSLFTAPHFCSLAEAIKAALRKAFPNCIAQMLLIHCSNGDPSYVSRQPFQTVLLKCCSFIAQRT